ncbi:hypothetical protein K438DRAFT_1746745 [Mycena galopus ATCC 62051]|nr:hypothetical protein K438DRAFT_1746745 [Mycena galopus ATCC 62051]
MSLGLKGTHRAVNMKETPAMGVKKTWIDDSFHYKYESADDKEQPMKSQYGENYCFIGYISSSPEFQEVKIKIACRGKFVLSAFKVQGPKPNMAQFSFSTQGCLDSELHNNFSNFGNTTTTYTNPLEIVYARLDAAALFLRCGMGILVVQKPQWMHRGRVKVPLCRCK